MAPCPPVLRYVERDGWDLQLHVCGVDRAILLRGSADERAGAGGLLLAFAPDGLPLRGDGGALCDVGGPTKTELLVIIYGCESISTNQFSRDINQQDHREYNGKW